MVYQIATLREYVRSLDARLENTVDFPDTWIDARIQEGIAISQDDKPIFSTKEIYNISNNILVDLVAEVEILLQQEVHSVFSVTLDDKAFSYLVTPNNHIVVSKLPMSPVPTSYDITVRYYFYPTLPITELEMSLEMFKYVKEGIAVNAFGYLSDETNQAMHQRILDRYKTTGAFDTEKDQLNCPDSKLWSRTFC